ncbi:MAG TPA: ATP synthase F0 subunit B [Clostridiales bacterium]|nr:ATP synthase F0 subunit B [Clostridiales bacterium]
MSIEEVLDMLDELLDKSWSLPLSGGRCVVDAEKVRDYIDDIRINLPNEIKQAKAIVNDRNEILEAAHREAESIIRKAEERARALIAQEEIIKISQSKANEILAQTQMQSREIRQAAQTFSDDILRVTEEAITNALNEIKQTRQALRSKIKKK